MRVSSFDALLLLEPITKPPWSSASIQSRATPVAHPATCCMGTCCASRTQPASSASVHDCVHAGACSLPALAQVLACQCQVGIACALITHPLPPKYPPPPLPLSDTSCCTARCWPVCTPHAPPTPPWCGSTAPTARSRVLCRRCRPAQRGRWARHTGGQAGAPGGGADGPALPYTLCRMASAVAGCEAQVAYTLYPWQPPRQPAWAATLCLLFRQGPGAQASARSNPPVRLGTCLQAVDEGGAAAAEREGC